MIAAAMAMVQRLEFERLTILAELDVERPSMAATLGLSPSPGLLDVMRGRVDLESAIQWCDTGLGVVVAGEADGDPAAELGLLSSHRVIPELQTQCEALVADLPPLSTGAPAKVLAEQCAFTFLVVRAGMTPLARIERAAASLHPSPPVILNGTHVDSRQRLPVRRRRK
jgi:Mrp family chromosome partitioning ATPase